MSDKFLERLEALEAKIQKANITPENLHGSLTAEQSDVFLSAVMDVTDGFLGKLTVVRMSKLKKDIDVLGLATRVLRRVAQGSKPTDDDWTAFNPKPKTLYAKDAQLFARILKDTIRDNKNRPDLASFLLDKMGTQYRNDMVDLACNGNADTYDNNADNDVRFLSLHKGYYQLALDSADTHKVSLNPVGGDDLRMASTTDTQYVITVYEKMLDALPDKWDTDELVLIQAKAHIRKFNRILRNAGLDNGRIEVVEKGNLISFFEDVELVRGPKMPTDRYILTPAWNLYFGINDNIELDRGYDIEERAWKYVWDASFDFEFAIDDAVVVAGPEADVNPV
ncbi:MAG: hypothetical protein D6712_17815 [Chloroflexi bacterium]|nr:MAG: hypothetical protein D6712_17815 [Chloroflexota bacterium]